MVVGLKVKEEEEEMKVEQEHEHEHYWPWSTGGKVTAMILMRRMPFFVFSVVWWGFRIYILRNQELRWASEAQCNKLGE